MGLRQAEILEKLRGGRRDRASVGTLLVPPGRYGGSIPGYLHPLQAPDRRRSLLERRVRHLTNRSMGVDTELHASWETSPDEASSPLGVSIRDIRVSLLAEHSGQPGSALAMFGPMPGLVGRLDAIVDQSRLSRHGPPRPAQRAAMELLDPQSLPFDPADRDAADTAALEEPSDQRRRGRLPSALAATGRWLGRRVRRR